MAIISKFCNGSGCNFVLGCGSSRVGP